MREREGRERGGEGACVREREGEREREGGRGVCERKRENHRYRQRYSYREIER